LTPAPSPAAQSSYTIAHAGKQVRFGPVVFWIVVGTVVIMGAWSAATATYFAFRDDVLTRLLHDAQRVHGPHHPFPAEIRRTLSWLGQVQR